MKRPGTKKSKGSMRARASTVNPLSKREPVAHADQIPLKTWAMLFLAAVLWGALLGGLFYRPSVRALLTNTRETQARVVDEFNDQGAQAKQKAKISGQPVFTEYGIVLGPGQDFSMTWTGKKKPTESPYAMLFMYGGQIAENTVQFESGGKTERYRVPHSTSQQIVRSTGLGSGSSEFSITVASRIPQGVQSGAMILDRIEFGAAEASLTMFQNDFWALLPLSFLPLMTVVVLQRRFPFKTTAVIAIALCGGALIVSFGGSAARESLAGFVVMAGVVSVLLDYFGILRIGVAGASVALCSALLALAAWHRWEWFLQVYQWPLLPDAVHYMELAERMTWPYDTGAREPLFMWPIRIFSALTSWGNHSMRILTIGLALVEGVVLFLLTREFLGRFGAALVMLLYAFCTICAYFSVQGLREELLPTMLMLFLWACIQASKPDKSWKAHLLIGLAAAGAVLTRLNALSFVVPIYAAMAWRSRWSVKSLAVPAAILFLLVTPHLIRNRIVFGDAFHTTNMMIKGYKNFEFMGKPGHPTREQVAQNQFVGPAISARDYLFKLHTPREVFRKSTDGMWRLMFGKEVRNGIFQFDLFPVLNSYHSEPISFTQSAAGWEKVIYLFYIIGFIAIWFKRHGWLIPITIVLFQLPLAFLAGSNLLHIRLVMVPACLMLLLAGFGLVWPLEKVLELRRKQTTRA